MSRYFFLYIKYKVPQLRDICPEVISIPENWDCTESVKKIKAVVYKWKNLTEEILRELWIAREVLSLDAKSQPRTTDGTFVPTDKTWQNYCDDIEIDKRTANRWLNAFKLGWQSVLLSQTPEWFTPADHP